VRRRIYRLVVETYDVDFNEWEAHGSVLLPYGACPREVEHALASLGFYCPRGADRLSWAGNVGAFALAIISDGNDRTFLRLVRAESEAA